MDPSQTPSIQCPGCGKTYRWKSQLVGRQVRCHCSQRFRVPENPQAHPETVGSPQVDESRSPYEVDDPWSDSPYASPSRQSQPAPTPSPQTARPSKCPSCNRPLKPEAVLCLNCGYNLNERRKMQTAVQPATDEIDHPGADASDLGQPTAGVAGHAIASTLAGGISARRQRDEEMAAEAERDHRFNEFYLPLILIGVAVPLNAIIALTVPLLIPGPGWDLGRGLEYMLRAVGRLIVQFPTIVVGIFVVAKLFGTSYGGLGTGLLKLLAITATTGLAFDATVLGILMLTGGHSVFGAEQTMSLLIACSVFWCLCIKLFEMETLEILVMILILIVGPFVIALFIIGPILAALLG